MVHMVLADDTHDGMEDELQEYRLVTLRIDLEEDDDEFAEGVHIGEVDICEILQLVIIVVGLF